ncbi:MAG: biotin--[acetyl-CoA-carboxylase] ligase, partial [Longimicrobiales bacterium]
MPELHLFARVSSTNDVLRARAAAGAPAGAVAIADSQTAGRGQHGRSWDASPSLSLLMSVLLRPRSGEALGAAPIRAGLALARALEDAAELDVRLK